jgi:hypothetical protein
MADYINLAVVWPKDGRTVTVRVEITLAVEEGVLPLPITNPINPLDLVSIGSLYEFLARLTRIAAAGSTVEASIPDFRFERLLELLDITAPVPDPKRVKLPDV